MEKNNQVPLTAQQRMWCRLDNGSAFDSRYICPIVLRVSGPVDTAALQLALDDVVLRHEVLRTEIVRDADSPHQGIYPPSAVPLRIEQVTLSESESRDLRAEEFLFEAEKGTLDVGELPLLRAVLSTFDDQDSVLTVLAHHIAVDAWSLQLIIRDLAECYTARAGNRPTTLPRLKQYREYADWEQVHFTGAALAASLEFWREQLRGAHIFGLPMDHPEARTKNYVAHGFVIEADTMAAASALAKSARATTFMVLLSAFDVLAHQIVGTTDPVINTISTGRNNPHFHDTIGPFLNFIPLRATIGACGTFREILDSVRGSCIAAYAHEIPVQEIDDDNPELMRPVRGATPLTDFILGYFSRPFKSSQQLADGSYVVTPRQLKDRVSPQLPGGVAWTMNPSPSGQLICTIEVNLDEFEEETVTIWEQGFRRILTRATADPDQSWETL